MNGKPPHANTVTVTISDKTERVSEEASIVITNYIKGYYSQLSPHQYNGGLTLNESE